MPPNQLGAALAAAGSLYQLGTGIQQGIRARRLAKADRPWYSIPTEISDNQKAAKNAYGASTLYGLPGQGQMQAANDRSQASTMTAMQQAQQNPASLLAGYAALDQNAKNTNADLAVKAAQYRAGQMNATRGQMMTANNAMAKYKDQAFNINYMKPYESRMAASSALRQAAITNVGSAIKGLGNLGAQVAARSGNNGGGTPSFGGGTPSGGGAGGSWGNDTTPYVGEGIDDAGLMTSAQSLLGKPGYEGMDVNQIIELLKGNK